MVLAAFILLAAAAYIAIGILFACALVLRGLPRIDPAADHAPWSFRILIIPGIAALWPLMLIKWVRSPRMAPREPHL